MIKVKNVKMGDYVFLAKYSDKDPYDPWYVGFIIEHGQDKRGPYYRTEQNDKRLFRHVWKVTGEEGTELINNYRDAVPYGLKA